MKEKHNNKMKKNQKMRPRKTFRFFGVEWEKWIYKWNHCEFHFSNWRSNKQVAHHSFGAVPPLYQAKGILSIIEKMRSLLASPQHNGDGTYRGPHLIFHSSPRRIIHRQHSSVTLPPSRKANPGDWRWAELHLRTVHGINAGDHDHRTRC